MNHENFAPQKGAAPAFTVRADKLIRELCTDRESLYRRMDAELTRGVHWEVVNKHRALTLEGAARLRSAVTAEQAPTPIKTPPRKAPLLLGPVAFKGELIAWMSPVRNEKLLIGYLPGTDPTNPLALVNILVRSNRNFIRGMVVKQVRKIGPITYEASGRPPRWRGKY